MSALAEELRSAVVAALKSPEGREALREVLAELLPAQPPGEDKRLVGVGVAAERLGLGQSTVRKLAGRCELPSVPIGRRLLFRPADLDAYAEARRRSPERVRELTGKA